jgi:signal transduction histidine kinase
VHFDPVPSQDSSAAVGTSEIQSDDFIDNDSEEVEQEQPPARKRQGLPAPASASREGLPPAFRMRHQPHYVEQLMGDAPIKTVRDIAISDIEAPPDDLTSDLAELEASIRRMGVLEPLLVRQQGKQYHVITGLNRLRAARSVGLRSVPCIVHDVDEEMLKNMREAVTQRAVPPPPPAPAPVEVARDINLPPAFSEVTAGLQFVSALLPAITAADGDRFRWSVLTDLAAIELQRARTVATAAEILAGQATVNRADSDCGDLVGGVVQSLAAEARLRGLRLDLQTPETDFRLSLDAGLAATAITGVIQGLFTLLPAGAASIRVQVKGTTVRPALIVQVSQEAVDLDAEAARRFFDGEWREHPSGGAGSLLLAGAARIARLHGGRVDVQQLPMKGCIVTFVIPKPIGE